MGATNGTFPEDVRTAAEVYLGDALVPIRLPYRGKNPGRDGWERERPTFADLDRHFPRGITLNIGVLNGEPSGNTADVDCDCPEARKAAPILLPPTGWRFGRQSAPGGHWIYRTDFPLGTAQVEFYDDVGKAMLLELRGTGGQTVFPPSTHQETGELIRWEERGALALIPLADLQTAVGNLGACTLLAKHWPGADSKARQKTYLALSGALLRSERPVDWIERFNLALATATDDEEALKRMRCAQQSAKRAEQERTTWGWPELARRLGPSGEHLCRRVRAWLGIPEQQGPRVTFGAGAPPPPGDAEPWGKPVPLTESRDVLPFPIETYPPVVATFAGAVARSMNCPIDYAAVPILGTAGGSVGGARALEIKPGHTVLPNIYAATVGPPGSAKSPAQKAVTEAIHEIDAELARKSAEERKQYRMEVEDHKEDLKEWRKKDDGSPRPEEPTAPMELRAVVGDVTAERLKDLLSMNPKGLIRENDELTGLVMSLNAYRSGKGTDRQLYLSAWNGRLETTDRVKDKAEGSGGTRNHVACLSVLGGLTPDNLFLFKGEVRKGRSIEDGWFDRILFSFADPPNDAAENWECVDRGTAESWAGIVRRLRGLEPRQDTYPDGTTVYKPELLRLTECGRAAWQEFTAVHAAEKNADDFPGHLKGIWAKLRGYCPRLALIVHCLRWAAGELADDRAGVDGESIRRAVKLVTYFKSHARKVAVAIDLDSRVADAKSVLNWLRKYVRFAAAEKGKPTDRFQVRDAFEGTKGTLETMDRLNLALDILEQHGYIRPLAQPSQPGPGRRRSPWYQINPDLGVDSHNSHNGSPDEPDRDDDPPPAPTGNSANSANQFEEPVAQPTDNGGPDAEPTTGDSANCANRSAEEPTPAAGGYVVVIDAGGLEAVRSGLEDCQGERVYLDTETTGLDPLTDRVRLLSLSVPSGEGRVVYVVDAFQVSPAPLWESLAGCEVVGHNLVFDLQFLARLGFQPGATTDTMLLAGLDVAGTNDKVNLAACVQRYLGRELNKAEQASDWSGTLTPEQLRYAAEDVRILEPLSAELARTIRTIGVERAAEIECRALPAVAWLSTTGVAFDGPGWKERAVASDRAKAEAVAELDRLAPERTGEIFKDSWEWSKSAHIAEALKQVGHPVADTRDATLAGIDHPLAAALRTYRACEKQVSSYGNDWLDHAGADGRIHPHWHQLRAASGRMACSDPNLQQVPRDDSRRCFVAGPGNVLVKADYSQIELRIAARLTEDAALLAAYRRRDDLHTLTAKSVLGAKDVTKADRQLAKAVNFGLLFGMGHRGFRTYAKAQYGLELTEDQAKQYRSAFFKAYPGLRAWHDRTRNKVERLFNTDPDGVHEVRTLAGRRRVLKVGKKGTDGAYPNVTEALNTPVQGSGADGLKLALALLWERRAECPTAAPVLVVHDEIVLEVPEADAGPATDWLKRCMVDAVAPLLDPVPVEVEARAARTWGG